MVQEHLQARSTMTVGEVTAISRDLAKATARLQRTDDALRDLEKLYGWRPSLEIAINSIRRITASKS